MTDQPGYDALAQRYAETFPTPFTTSLEQHALEVFIDAVTSASPRPVVVDVGCGIGHVATFLNERGLTVIAIDPSAQMLRIASAKHPHIDFDHGDAALTGRDLSGVDALLARFSLIHLPPDEVRAVLTQWHRRLPSHAVLLVATQGSDDPGVHEFDHAVAPAWRWHADALAEALTSAGFTETWRTISRPGPGHRFPEIHILASVSLPAPT